MNVSFNWIKKYVKLPDSVTPANLGLKLTLSTVEVDGVQDLSQSLKNVVVGKVLSADAHPNADKLKVCEVDVGEEKLPIVCGGKNVVSGMLVALAKSGAEVRWHGEGELVMLSDTKIRGVESRGMICAGSEIGLSGMFKEGEGDILDLTEALKDKKEKKVIGQNLAEALALTDVVYDIDNKSMTHRPDLWGHYGIAREVAALYRRDVTAYETKSIKAGKEEKIKVKVEDTLLCPRYMAVKLSGIQVAESPEWLKRALASVGQKSINNIVDITNYLMLDIAEPMHAFDAGKVNHKDKETEILVRRAKKGEKIKLLDEREVELTTEDLVVADNKKPVALAGVMGGYDTAVDENTTEIILEAANFEPVIIRRAAFRNDARTDSSARFEKSLDPTLPELALNKAVELIKEVCPKAKVVSNVVDDSNYRLLQGPIELPLEFLNAKIGLVIPEKEVISILERLGFEVKKSKDILSVKVPSYRATKDISIPEDLVEEVARIYGYDNIEPQSLTFPVEPPEINLVRETTDNLRDVLTRGLGYSEVYNYSFISAKQIKDLKDKEKYLELDKPLSKERPYLRRHLLGGLLENVGRNLEFFDEVKMLEVGKTYLSEEPGARVSEGGDDLLPRQDTYLTLAYAKKKDSNPFVAVRRALDLLVDSLKINFQVQPMGRAESFVHPTRAGEVLVGDVVVGYIAEVSPEVVKNFGIDSRVATLNINLNLLSENYEADEIKCEMPSIYPEVVRDIAFVVDKSVTHQDIMNELLSIGSSLKEVNLFDIYQGENIAADKKSMAYSLTYSLPDRTLTSEEVDKEVDKAIKVLQDKFKVEIRK